MRLIWTADGPVSSVWATLMSKGYASAALTAKTFPGEGRIPRRFPILMSETGGFIEEAFRFLFDIAYLRGATTSIRTLETYAESLLSWITYADGTGLPWQRPTVSMLATFRDYLLGTRGSRARPLSRRTVNLRLTVVIEFYKYLGLVTPDTAPQDVALPRPHFASPSGYRMHTRSTFQRLRLRVYSRRPVALPAEQCRALCSELDNPYRLMWQWALCTGLRTVSLVQIGLDAFQKLSRSGGETLEIGAKGGRLVSVTVPTALREATERYIATGRVIAAVLTPVKPQVQALFLNRWGRPVTSKAYYRALKRAARRLKITAHPHQARTTFATHVRNRLEKLGREGLEVDPIKVVQSLLAHADARTTERYLESIDVPSVDVLTVLDELCRTTVGAGR
jgi:integrase